MSAFEIQFKIDLDAISVADALVTTIDAIRIRKKELETLKDELPHSHETNRMRAIQEEHEKLLRLSSDLTVNDTSFAKDFLKTLANAGADISYDGYRQQLRTYIRYWSNDINEKEGGFPIIQLQPFDESKIQERVVKEIEHDEAELEHQAMMLAIEKERLELLQERLELEKNRLEFAIETAKKVVDTLHPNADEQTTDMLIQSLLPDLLKLSNSKGLVLTLPTPQSNE